jgi:hypothetical protein
MASQKLALSSPAWNDAGNIPRFCHHLFFFSLTAERAAYVWNDNSTGGTCST